MTNYCSFCGRKQTWFNSIIPWAFTGELYCNKCEGRVRDGEELVALSERGVKE